MVAFGQVVLGPPGSGKSTYCKGMHEFLTGTGRKVAIVNLDPGNENPPFTAEVDIRDLITIEDSMAEFKLGPNGALMYCMEFIEKNFDWVLNQLAKFPKHYFLFDLPGQVELYTHHCSVKNMVELMAKKDFRLCAVNLVDSHYCSDAGKFISALLVSLTTMLQLALPHINILSKIDLAQKYGKLEFGLDYYMDVMDLNFLLDTIPDDPFMCKFAKLNEALVGIVQDYSLVSFYPLDVEKKEMMFTVRSAIDKANGYVFGVDEKNFDMVAAMSFAVGADFEYARVGMAREMMDETDES
ncbi:unnamed protein product [Notodromas monacha]|uniref:GPN-loop GTPase 2 n=1 Tax=Notodromas monacha TaxID=399045 RepID=A0A7R9GGG7_9CRUS|nr:unnamed protein product [Notodromas monacha]CAG0921827.1 unnamed protein product [Notodromas monacha]